MKSFLFPPHCHSWKASLVLHKGQMPQFQGTPWGKDKSFVLRPLPSCPHVVPWGCDSWDLAQSSWDQQERSWWHFEDGKEITGRILSFWWPWEASTKLTLEPATFRQLVKCSVIYNQSIQSETTRIGKVITFAPNRRQTWKTQWKIKLLNSGKHTALSLRLPHCFYLKGRLACIIKMFKHDSPKLRHSP